MYRYADIMKCMEEILRLHINVTEVVEVKGFAGTGRLVLFDGWVEGKYFNGKIANGGVDTQKEIKDPPAGTLSARYIVTGKDSEGKDCKLFIENNGSFSEEYTNPKIYTDSENLRWMESACLKGKITNVDGELVILIFNDAA